MEYESENLEVIYNFRGVEYVLFFKLNLLTKEIIFHIERDGNHYKQFNTYQEAIEAFWKLKPYLI